MKILNFGSCNIDYVYSMNHIVTVGETAMAYNLELFPGGKGLNQSIATARAGAEIFHAGCVGNDGEMLRKILEDSGVNVSFLKRVDEKNGHAIIQVSDAGDNSIFIYPGSNEMITRDFVDQVLKSFSSEDILLLQNEINDIGYIIEKAHSKGMCVVFNPSPINEVISKIDLNMISYLVLNEVEAREITAIDYIDGQLAFFEEKYPNLKVILTLGKQGSVMLKDGNRIRQEAYKVTAVDTTAAGDTFTGYFVAGLAQKTDDKALLDLASVASAIAVSRKGAAPSIPTMDEVLHAVGTLEPNGSENKPESFKKRLEEYIDNNLQSASIKEVAAYLNYSVIYSGSLVKKLTGQTFTALLQERRCMRASRLLLDTDLPISEIIARVGYENESFFRKKFSEKYGANPLEYRKNKGKTQ